MNKLYLLSICSLIMNGVVVAKNPIYKDKFENVKFKLQTASCIYHLYNIEGFSNISPDDRKKLYEGFENFFTSFITQLSPKSSLVLGVTLNSFGEMSFVAGYRRNWIDISKRLSFVGQYCYVGEFFFKQFRSVGYVGDPSIYRSMREKLGVGFAPFIFHGVNYNINSMISVDLGFVFPNLLASTFIFNLNP